MFTYNEFLEYSCKTFPYWKEVFIKEPPAPFLFANNIVELNNSDFIKINNFIKYVYKLRNHPKYINDIIGDVPLLPQKSILMSFDFHITNSGPKLIEINTNASHFLTSFAYTNYVSSKLQKPSLFPNALEELTKSFLNEMSLFDKNRPLKNILIVDDNPVKQKAYTEFLMYKSLFESQDISCSISDVALVTLNAEKNAIIDSSNKVVDFIYNRHTDFYFETDNLKIIEQAYSKQLACVSPNPHEYQLLADKKRLLDFSTDDFLNKYLEPNEAYCISECLLKTFYTRDFSKQELWDNRKKFFFKPSTSFGSKGVYEGAKITKKVFETILNSENYLAQEIAVPQKIEIQVDGKTQNAKYDLRFFVYNGEIQHVAARSYIGQTTNFQTLGGGFSPVFLK